MCIHPRERGPNSHVYMVALWDHRKRSREWGIGRWFELHSALGLPPGMPYCVQPSRGGIVCINYTSIHFGITISARRDGTWNVPLDWGKCRCDCGSFAE